MWSLCWAMSRNILELLICTSWFESCYWFLKFYLACILKWFIFIVNTSKIFKGVFIQNHQEDINHVGKSQGGPNNITCLISNFNSDFNDLYNIRSHGSYVWHPVVFCLFFLWFSLFYPIQSVFQSQIPIKQHKMNFLLAIKNNSNSTVVVLMCNSAL